MKPTTRQQREALRRIFDRSPLYYKQDGTGFTSIRPYMADMREPITYREFRKQVQQGYDCLMVQWCGMWLGIEPDGYTHS